MNSFLIMDDEDMDFIWDTIQKIQIIFHPEIAPYGEFDFNKFYEIPYKLVKTRVFSLELLLSNAPF